MTKERMTKDEALKLALEALDSDNPDIQLRAAIIIRGVLAQPEQKRPQNCGTGYCSCIECVMEPEQEPVAWLHRQGNFTEACMNPLHDDEIDRGWTQEPLYTTPPQRKPLDERERAWIVTTCPTPRHIINAVEAAHGIGKPA